MSLFKKTNLPPQTQSARAAIVPSAAGFDPTTNTALYEVNLESNNADLINENVNEIEIVAVAAPVNALAPGTPISNANLNQVVTQRAIANPNSKTRKVHSLDPKRTISHGEIARSANSIISDNIIRENVVFSEKRIRDLSVTRNLDLASVKDGNLVFEHLRGQSVTTSNLLLGSTTVDTTSRQVISPLVKNRTEQILPKKSTVGSRIRVSKNEQIEIRLKDKNGSIVGRVGRTGSRITPSVATADKTDYLPAFHLLNTKRDIFKINVSRDENGTCLHVISRFKQIFNEYAIYIRYLSDNPIRDTYNNLGKYNSQTSSKIYLKVDLDRHFMVNVVPIYKGKRLCWSQTYINPGIVSSSTTNICAYHTTIESRQEDIVSIKVYNYPPAAKQYYIVRTDEKTKQTVRFENRLLVNNDDMLGVSDFSFTFNDPTTTTINNIYRYDCFIIDSNAFEKHIGSVVLRTFEKDFSGIKFVGGVANTLNNTHIINFVLSVPDLYLPRSDDDLNNPGDGIFEAARQGKKIAILQLVRHSSYEPTQIIDTFTINPVIGDIKTEVDDNGNISGQFLINSDFARKYGLSRISEAQDYIYELRAGCYMLSNELSFLSNPVKLVVPNEFTAGKVGYSYHPYLYDSPLSKDFGIIPKLGEDKQFMRIEALTSTSQIFKFEKNATKKASVSLRTRLGCNQFGEKQQNAYVTLSANISSDLLKQLDHIEVFSADSTHSNWRTLGKHYITESDFYFIDDVSTSAAANKLKYCIIGRNMAFQEVFRTTSKEINISKYNYIERPASQVSKSLDKQKAFKLR